MVQSPQDLIEDGYACLDDDDVHGAVQFLEEYRLQFGSRLPSKAHQRAYDELSRAIREKKNQLTPASPQG